MTDEFDELIERSEVTVTTPNGNVTATVRGERDVTVGFAPGFYATCSTVQLQDNLQTVARLLFVAARREHLEQIRAFTGRDADEMQSRPEPQTPRDHDYYTRLAKLCAEGESDDGLVSVSAVGQQEYVGRVKPGGLDRVPQAQMEASCAQAANRMLAETEQKAAAARWEIYMASAQSA